MNTSWLFLRLWSFELSRKVEQEGEVTHVDFFSRCEDELLLEESEHVGLTIALNPLLTGELLERAA